MDRTCANTLRRGCVGLALQCVLMAAMATPASSPVPTPVDCRSPANANHRECNVTKRPMKVPYDVRKKQPGNMPLSGTSRQPLRATEPASAPKKP